MAVKRIVVLRALGLGDFCTGVPALRALARHYTRDRLVLAQPPALAELPSIFGLDVELVPIGSFAALATAVPTSAHGIDVAVNLHGRGPQSTAALQQLQPRRLISFGAPGVDGATVEWRDDEHDGERWCRLLEANGIVTAESDRTARLRCGSDRADRALTIVHVGAAHGARRWPLDRWARLVTVLVNHGHQVVLTGGHDERRLTTVVATITDLAERANLAGRTNLTQLAHLIASARVVVSGDTGVAHLAFACATPTVTLYGPSSPAAWGPPPRPQHRVLWAGRTGDARGGDVDAGLLDIGVDDVVLELANAGHLPAAA